VEQIFGQTEIMIWGSL